VDAGYSRLGDASSGPECKFCVLSFIAHQNLLLSLVPPMKVSAYYQLRLVVIRKFLVIATILNVNRLY
jgi:hypothetical protein